MANDSAATSRNGRPGHAQVWLSRTLSDLFDRQSPRARRPNEQRTSRPHFDVLIVGSGYGGAVAAAALAGSRLASKKGKRRRRLRIGVLERGREYLPGAFPSQISDLPGHVRMSFSGDTNPTGLRTGLFDVRVAPDVVTVVANGVGGGSLINAGVMLPPHPKVLTESRWPSEIRSAPGVLDRYYARAADWLGAGSSRAPNTVEHAGLSFPKVAAMRRLDRAAITPPTTVAFEPAPHNGRVPRLLLSSGGLKLTGCTGCGDCATGCNVGAKLSLDVTLLLHARRHGVELYTGATVLRLERTAEGETGGRKTERRDELGASPRWRVFVNHTDEALRHRQREPLCIEADKVILAAGTFGSTEILLRSQGPALRLSGRLGQQFSGNGDLFAAAYHVQEEKVNAFADESVARDDRGIGPTITTMIDDRRGDPEHDLSIQELAVPAALRRLFEEVFTTARTLHSLGEADRKPHAPGDRDRNAVDRDAFDRSLALALIGRDSADGELILARGTSPDRADEGDGAVHVRWPGASDDPRFDRHLQRVEKRLAQRGVHGQLLPNPGWKPVPNDVARTFGIKRGPLLTVHPLGGCPMGDNVHSGVVNHLGQVFSDIDPAHPAKVYEDLVVLDGSIVPTSLGINPALTIAALALRAIETLRDECWHLVTGPGLGRLPKPDAKSTIVRPLFFARRDTGPRSGGGLEKQSAARKAKPAAPPPPTRVQLMERLRGVATLADGHAHELELTLHSHPVALGDLMSPTGRRRFCYDPNVSVLRVFRLGRPDRAGVVRRRSPLDEDPVGPPPLIHAGSSNGAPLFVACAPVSGSLDVLALAPTTMWGRLFRALPAWWLSRGMRDIVQAFAGRVSGLAAPADTEPPPGWLRGLWNQAAGVLAIATRAGAVRTLDYELELGALTVAPDLPPADLFGRAAARPGATLKVRGHKTLTYDGVSSPWLQLMELALDEFPGMRRRAPTLSLDLPYLARQGVPLLRVVSQHNHVQALIDVASFGLYVLRTILDGHMWSFRLPDRTPSRDIHRLPGPVRGLPSPEVTELQVDEVGHKTARRPVHLRLTRYRPRIPRNQPPVVLIHGYSASGTTFVHPTLQPGLARRLVRDGRDVWVLDLRSSAGMPWGAYPWTFEQVGCEDIPVAVDHVVTVTGHPTVDVVAHCMGSAMLCMALLRDPRAAHGDGYPGLCGLLAGRIRRIVLSQVGPLLIMSPANQTRAYAMRYVRQLLPDGEYRFRVDDDKASMVDKLLDRLLATLPYSRAEARMENPRWPPWAVTPWVQSRHRMDMLYGETFKAANLSPETLGHLDDFFGPMSVATVSQVIHFANTRAITDAQGRHVFATQDRLKGLSPYEILSIHGRDNGLVDVSTADLLERGLALPRYKAERFAGFGHQDCLIGRNNEQILDTIVRFLDVGHSDEPARHPRGARPALEATDEHLSKPTDQRDHALPRRSPVARR